MFEECFQIPFDPDSEYVIIEVDNKHQLQEDDVSLPVQHTEIDLSQSRVRDDHAKIVVQHGHYYRQRAMSPGRMSAIAHWVRRRMAEKGWPVDEFPTYHAKTEKVFPVYGQTTVYFG